MALVLAFGVAAVRDLAIVPVLLALACGVVWATATPVLRRLRGPAVLAAGIALGLALTAGETVLWRAGPLALRAEGLAAGALVAGRLLAIVAMTLALLAPLTPQEPATGLRRLGLPAAMADLALLTLRYVDELQAELGRARLARALRGGVGGWRALPDHGLILAAALIRAEARAERLWAAMRLRGHGAQALDALPLGMGGWARIGLAVLAALTLVALDRSL